MLRAVLYILLGIFVISVVRLLAGVVLKGAADLFQGAAGEKRASGGTPAGGELKKDPVCGTYVPAISAFKKTVAGHEHYFCSAGCRDKFQA